MSDATNDRFPSTPCPGCGNDLVLGHDVVGYRTRVDGAWRPEAWHRECLNADCERRGVALSVGPTFDVPDASGNLAPAFGVPAREKP